MGRDEHDRPSLGAKRFDGVPAHQVLHGCRDFLLGAEQSPRKLSRTLPDLDRVLAGEPGEGLGTVHDAARPEVLEDPRAVPARKGEGQPTQEGAHGVVHAQRQAGEQAEKESQGISRRSVVALLK